VEASEGWAFLIIQADMFESFCEFFGSEQELLFQLDY
jgi:hypothetical protein